MSDAQRRSYETLSPRFCIPFASDPALPPAAGPLNDRLGFGNDKPVTIEIGFGMGIATAMIAEANPQQNYLGLEVHRPGIGRLLWEIEKRSLQNIRVIEHDAVEVLQQMIPANSVAGFHIFFPDPWPKKRHHKRRLITRPFTDLLAEKLKDGAAIHSPRAYIYMVTDWEDYGDWALAELSATPGLRNPYEGGGLGGFAPPQEWRPRTKFEQKGIDKNHKMRELYFVKE
jgi:tRNA (guanine-N7-)-methyltransferase